MIDPEPHRPFPPAFFFLSSTQQLPIRKKTHPTSNTTQDPPCYCCCCCYLSVCLFYPVPFNQARPRISVSFSFRFVSAAAAATKRFFPTSVSQTDRQTQHWSTPRARNAYNSLKNKKPPSGRSTCDFFKSLCHGQQPVSRCRCCPGLYAKKYQLHDNDFFQIFYISARSLSLSLSIHVSHFFLYKPVL